jgi:hypothetical protein
MAIQSKAAMAAGTVVVALLAVQYLVLPVHDWTAVVVVSMFAVALSVGAMIYMPAGFMAGAATDGGRIARTGPAAITAGLSFLLSLVALGTTFLHFSGLSWALLVLALACFIVGLLATNATSETADRVQTLHAKDERYRGWSSALIEISRSVGDSTLQSQCTTLAEELRYAPSARSDDASNEASQVSKAISKLRQSVHEGDLHDAASKLKELEMLLGQHSAALVALRSHA